MIILGIVDSKPSAAAIVVDGEIVAAVAEERLCRMKLAYGLPRAAIGAVMALAGVGADDIDHVAVAQRASIFLPEPLPWKGWFDDDAKTGRFDQLSGLLAPALGRFPVSWKVHHEVKRWRSRERVQKIPPLLQELYGIGGPVTFHDHHLCHAATAYYSSGWDEALVVTLDGGGDGLSGSVYMGREGRLQRLSIIDSFNSLGNLYSYVTELCGFKAQKHEGKVTGLAAIGEPVYADILREIIRYEEPGTIRYAVPMYRRSGLDMLAERLPPNFDRAHLAASAQMVLEEVGSAFVRYWLRKSGLNHLAVAGGVFANVKFNQRLHELDEVERIFIHPAMDDGGLCVGSALVAQAEDSAFDPRQMIRSLSNVYFGMGFDGEEVAAVVQSAGYPASWVEDIHSKIAELLAQGFVVARFTGRMEYGPRALGHRSILYQTTNPTVNDWLNEDLNRTEFMPFAPATLVEYAHECYVGLAGAEDPARFMTITFQCTQRMQHESPGVVHVDGTARPQLVDAETAPDFYKILSAYHRLTGIPSLINTSFNMHEEPIVGTPADALRSFQQGNLHYLAIGKWLVTNPHLNGQGQMTERELRA